MLPVQVVCFDLGGVMIQIHHEWEGALSAAGFPVPKPVGPLGGFPEFDLYQKGAVSEEGFLAGLARHLDLAGLREARKVHMAILQEAYPGVDTLVAELVDRGIVCGCLSNTNALHWETFFDGGRYAYGPSLSVRIGSHLVGANKPDESIYEAFERDCGFRGSQVAYFDDGPANVAAAKARGWQSWLIDAKGDPAVQMRSALGL